MIGKRGRAAVSAVAFGVLVSFSGVPVIGSAVAAPIVVPSKAPASSAEALVAIKAMMSAATEAGAFTNGRALALAIAAYVSANPSAAGLIATAVIQASQGTYSGMQQTLGAGLALGKAALQAAGGSSGEQAALAIEAAVEASPVVVAAFTSGFQSAVPGVLNVQTAGEGTGTGGVDVPVKSETSVVGPCVETSANACPTVAGGPAT